MAAYVHDRSAHKGNDSACLCLRIMIFAPPFISLDDNNTHKEHSSFDGRSSHISISGNSTTVQRLITVLFMMNDYEDETVSPTCSRRRLRVVEVIVVQRRADTFRNHRDSKYEKEKVHKGFSMHADSRSHPSFLLFRYHNNAATYASSRPHVDQASAPVAIKEIAIILHAYRGGELYNEYYTESGISNEERQDSNPNQDRTMSPTAAPPYVVVFGGTDVNEAWADAPSAAMLLPFVMCCSDTLPDCNHAPQRVSPARFMQAVVDHSCAVVCFSGHPKKPTDREAKWEGGMAQAAVERFFQGRPLERMLTQISSSQVLSHSASSQNYSTQQHQSLSVMTSQLKEGGRLWRIGSSGTLSSPQKMPVLAVIPQSILTPHNSNIMFATHTQIRQLEQERVT